MNAAKPESILFVCYLNSIRSPMAEGLMKFHFADFGNIQSCGLASGELDDLMVAVMAEKNIDMSAHVAQTLGDVADTHFDLVIAFTESAGAAAEAAFLGTDTVVETWPLPDPTAGSLDVRAIMNNYRSIRDNLEARLKRRFPVSH